MAGEKNVEETEAKADRRERFVLRGGSEGIPESVPEEPDPAIDIREALERMGGPERRTRVRRHSQL